MMSVFAARCQTRSCPSIWEASRSESRISASTKLEIRLAEVVLNEFAAAVREIVIDSNPYPWPSRASVTWLPMNPAPPEMKILQSLSPSIRLVIFMLLA